MTTKYEVALGCFTTMSEFHILCLIMRCKVEKVFARMFFVT